MYIKLIEQERREVETMGWAKEWALLLKFKEKTLWILPMQIRNLIDWDDDNIIKQARAKAKQYYISLKEKNNG